MRTFSAWLKSDTSVNVLAFMACFIVFALTYWTIPYAHLEFPDPETYMGGKVSNQIHIPSWTGLIFVFFIAAALEFKGRGFKKVILLAATPIPLVVAMRVVYEMTLDASLHPYGLQEIISAALTALIPCLLGFGFAYLTKKIFT